MQRTRIDDGAGQAVPADLGRFFDQANVNFPPARLRLLLEPDRRRQSRWPAADDDDIEFHRLARRIGRFKLMPRHVFPPNASSARVSAGTASNRSAASP